MKMKIIKYTHIIVAASILIFGIVALILSRDYTFGSFSTPKEGFAPTVFSILIIAFSVVNLAIEVWKKAAPPKDVVELNWKKWAGYMLICIVYVTCLKRLGYCISTACALLAMLRLSGLKNWKKAIIIAIIYTVISYLIFTYGMTIRLPAGIFI